MFSRRQSQPLHSKNRTVLLVAVGTLFLLPLTLLIAHGMGEGGALRWEGLFLGALYSLCGLGVINLIAASLGGGERREDPSRMEGQLEEKERQIAYLEEQMRSFTRQPIACPIEPPPSVVEPKRELEEAIEKREEWGEESPLSPTRAMNTKYEAGTLLQHCLEKAQSLTGIPHLGQRSRRLRSLSLDNYAIDLRRLFDSLRNETSAAVVLFSKEEKRLLFANDVVKAFFGWGPERFVKEFSSLVRAGRVDWEEAMGSLRIGQKVAMRLVIEGRSGDNILVHSTWGVIPQGIFEKMVIGILFP